MTMVVMGPDIEPPGTQEAKAVIDAVLLSSRRSRLTIPDPDALAADLRELQSDYISRRMIDDMESLPKFHQAYSKLTAASKALRNAIAGIHQSWSADYFLLGTVQDPVVEDELDRAELHAADALAQRLIGRAEVALKAVEAVKGSGNRRRWYELAEGAAGDWLYGHGIPCLFEKNFSSIYSIPGEQKATSPGLRFALAVLPIVGLPATSQSNLRDHAKKGKQMRGMLALAK